MHIIPPGLTAGQQTLAERLIAGALNSIDQAAVAILLRLPYLLSRLGLDHLASYDMETDDDRGAVPAVAVRWPYLAGQVADHLLPVSRGEHAAVQIAAQLAGSLGDYLSMLDSPMRATVVEAIAHACGVPDAGRGEVSRLRAERDAARADLRALQARLATGDVRPGTGDGTEAIPAGVDGRPVGDRCLRCGRLRYVADPPPYPCRCPDDTRPTLGDLDDPRDHDEEHAADRDYAAEYGPETGDVGRCPACGQQTRSYSRGCSACGHGAEDGAR